jgi:hypothetical protein
MEIVLILLACSMPVMAFQDPAQNPTLGASSPSNSVQEQPTTEERDFWSFRPLQHTSPPESADKSVSGLDRFVLAELEKRGLSFAAAAAGVLFAVVCISI